MSPLVWNVVFDSLLRRLEELPAIKPRGYADDGMFLVSGCCPNTLVDLAQPAINAAMDWGSNNGLRFSAKKTQAIMFTRRTKGKGTKKLYINGMEIPSRLFGDHTQ